MTAIPEPSALAPAPGIDAVTFARMEGKIDLVLQSVGQLHDDSNDHETRLRSIESAYVSKAAVYAVFSIMAALMTVGLTAVALVVKQ